MKLDSIKCEYCKKKYKWIPVADKDPVKPGDYIVQLKSGIIIIYHFEKPVKFWREKVIAWQDLPDLYEEVNIDSTV